MKIESFGQSVEVWDNYWDNNSPEKEIRRWDYFGGRQYISKYVPRFGKVMEAGCGLGRYVFYFSKMGIDIEGVDFSEKIINEITDWQKENNFNLSIKTGDITNLSIPDNSIRGYISLGVIEHFIEGPKKALSEAYRVLEPGGIAIITTPSISWFVFNRRVKNKIRDIVKGVFRAKKVPKKFFQYEYTSRKLKKLVEGNGLHVTTYSGADLLFPFIEFGNYKGLNLRKGSFAYWFTHKFENTYLRNIGAQSITISIKVDKEMFCFLCGNKTAKKESLNIYSIPLCKTCFGNDLAEFYKKSRYPKYAAPYIINPPIKQPQEEVCAFSGEKYISDELFEDFGFNKKVSPQMLRVPEVNIRLCNENIQPVWRGFK